jgi:hypothetical protein
VCDVALHLRTSLYLEVKNKKTGREDGVDSSGWGLGPVASSCEHGNEPSGSTEVGKFTDQLRDN